MSAESTAIQAIFDTQLAAARDLTTGAQTALSSAFAAFTDVGLWAYEPYDWNVPSAPQIFFNPTYLTPIKPGAPTIPTQPTLLGYPALPNTTNPTMPVFTATAPTITFPNTPSGEPSDNTGNPPTIYSPTFGTAPALLTLPSYALPYPYITVPTPPTISYPSFDGVAPDDIASISLQEYLDKLTTSYASYSQDVPDLVRSHWFEWFRAMIGENPLIDKLATTISTYIDEGGSGIPEPIEEAIITRATDRVTAEQRRATLNVYDSAARRGLLLPSGMLLAGLKEARQTAAEAISKVATDTAMKNLELEHDHMKFMLQLGVELEKMIINFASDTAKAVLEANGQAIELTKLILTGMIEINNTIVRIYLAKWEGYKAAVEVYRAKISALEMQIRVYEAEIKAELAKVEINKAHVDVLTAVVNANRALVEMYKAGIDAESAKVESSRVAVMAFEATVRAYAARIEGYKAKWDGYRSATEGQVAKSKVYESQATAYTAVVNGYRAAVEGQSAIVKNVATTIEAIGKENEEQLKAWTAQIDGTLRAYVAGTEAYRAEWGAIGEQLRGYANAGQIMGEFLARMYTTETNIEMERAREHLAAWRSQLEGALHAAEGVTHTSQVAGNIAASALNGLSTFAGVLATSTA
jgi:hypothetical protein